MSEEDERALLLGAIGMTLDSIGEALREIQKQRIRRPKPRDPVAAALSLRAEQGLASNAANLARLLDQHQKLREAKARAAANTEDEPGPGQA